MKKHPTLIDQIRDDIARLEAEKAATLARVDRILARDRRARSEQHPDVLRAHDLCEAELHALRRDKVERAARGLPALNYAQLVNEVVGRFAQRAAAVFQGSPNAHAQFVRVGLRGTEDLLTDTPPVDSAAKLAAYNALTAAHTPKLVGTRRAEVFTRALERKPWNLRVMAADDPEALAAAYRAAAKKEPDHGSN